VVHLVKFLIFNSELKSYYFHTFLQTCKYLKLVTTLKTFLTIPPKFSLLLNSLSIPSLLKPQKLLSLKNPQFSHKPSPNLDQNFPFKAYFLLKFPIEKSLKISLLNFGTISNCKRSKRRDVR